MPPRVKVDQRAIELVAAAYGQADCDLIASCLIESAGSILVPEVDKRRLLQIIAEFRSANQRRHIILREHVTT